MAKPCGFSTMKKRTLVLARCRKNFQTEERVGHQQRMASSVAALPLVFHDRTARIDAHLEQPLALSTLEVQSGYSRRSLQLTFQQHYGCGPVQWIRRRRLERARQALLNPGPQDSVSAIAQRFGYRNLPAFSREFRLRYGQATWLLQREGRRSRP